HRIDIAQEHELAIEVRAGQRGGESLENVEVRFERSRFVHIAGVFTRPAERLTRSPHQARRVDAAVVKHSEVLFPEVVTDHRHDPNRSKPTGGNREIGCRPTQNVFGLPVGGSDGIKCYSTNHQQRGGGVGTRGWGNFGFWILDFRFWNWHLDFRFWILDFRSLYHLRRPLAAYCLLSFLAPAPSLADRLLLTAYCLLLTAFPPPEPRYFPTSNESFFCALGEIDRRSVRMAWASADAQLQFLWRGMARMALRRILCEFSTLCDRYSSTTFTVTASCWGCQQS